MRAPPRKAAGLGPAAEGGILYQAGNQPGRLPGGTPPKLRAPSRRRLAGLAACPDGKSGGCFGCYLMVKSIWPDVNLKPLKGLACNRKPFQGKIIKQVTAGLLRGFTVWKELTRY
jgi:hypothetical protein